MPFCPYCGKPTNPQNMFCASCGKSLKSLGPNVQTPDQQAPVQQDTIDASEVSSTRPPQPSSEHESILPKSTTETIKIVVPELYVMKGFGRTDTDNLIVTDRRSIFAKLTREVEEQAVKNHHAKIEAVKGAPGVFKWMAKIGKARAFIDWYSEKTPNSSLNESPGNYAVENSSIVDVFVTDDRDEDFPTYELEVTTNKTVLKFKTQHDPGKLPSVYGLPE